MKFLILGIILGIASNLFFFLPETGIEIYPEWHSRISEISKTEVLTNKKPLKDFYFTVKAGEDAYLLKSNGEINKTISSGGKNISISRNGKNYIIFEKVGKEIEYFNSSGERFWKIKSMEYPYISSNSKMIFLLNGDHSRIRIINNSGTELGAGNISGRFCTVISFSKKNDFGAAGFLDGSYYILDDKGNIIYSSSVSEGGMVKGMAISSNGNYAALHYGNTEKDYLMIIDLHDKKSRKIDLKHVHNVKAPLHVSDQGYLTFLDVDSIINYNKRLKKEFTIKITPRRHGTSSIDMEGDVYTVSYTMIDGESKLLVLKNDGSIVFSRNFLSESFLESKISNNFILLRGSDNLFCYRIQNRVN